MRQATFMIFNIIIYGVKVLKETFLHHAILLKLDGERRKSI